ncbi:EF-P beta-lysylation protein EpmB [Gammaproteobacteria bacterium 50_400_T64]|nr:EF-P beta-lysylation protein EpmB [Gammaproteobacteria bacterium 50_400_T64]
MLTADIIPHTSTEAHQPCWQEELAAAIRTPADLLERLELNPAQLDASPVAQQAWSLRVPLPYVQRMNKGDIDDPLLKQVLPLGAEMLAAPGFSRDPLGEEDANPVPGVVHKYQGRALLIISPACAIHCRYCFRRHFPYEDNTLGRKEWQMALDYLASDKSISEVIYSGGDPLAANDNFLLWITQQIATIPHIKRLRIHTRLPLVIPSRIDPSCLHWMTATRLKVVMVWHINHPNEIDQAVSQAAQRLKRHGIELLNQTVLLKQVNDSVYTLAELSEKLFDVGIMPYYIHRLDKVSGAAHFEVSDNKIQQLQQALLNALPGYLVPRFVCEQAGALSKLPLPLSTEATAR